MRKFGPAARIAAAFVVASTLTIQNTLAAPTEGKTEKQAEEEAPDRSDELDCLATAIYHEARGEPGRGQLLVGRVILNRVASNYYPDTICDVVYQNVHLGKRCQFSFACDGLSEEITEQNSWVDVKSRAEWLLNCEGDIDCQQSKVGEIWTSTHYHADYVHPRWANKILRLGQIGSHIFYYTETM